MTSSLIFPLKKDDLIYDYISEFKFITSTDRSRDDYGAYQISRGLIDDTRELENLAFATGNRKMIGIVHPNYFPYFFNGNRIVGYSMVKGSNELGKVAFVSGNYRILAHELGHLLGKAEIVPGLLRVDGYDNLKNESVTSSYALMNKIGFDPFWISNDTYQKIFQTLRNPQVDPEISIVSGIIDLDSSKVLKLEVDHFETGVLSTDVGNGDVMVKLEDSKGGLISSQMTTSNWKLIFDTADSEPNSMDSENMIQLKVIPFSVSFPRVDVPFKISIIMNNSLLVEDYRSNSFESIIEQLLLSDFESNNEARNKAHLRQMLKLANLVDLSFERYKIGLLQVKFKVLREKVASSALMKNTKLNILNQIDARFEQLRKEN